MNEIRRRDEETRSIEFQRLVGDVAGVPSNDMLTIAPERIKRIFDCDDVTYFVAQPMLDETKILVPWSSTSVMLGDAKSDHFYEISVDDGFTGFAATRREVLVIRNVDDREEVASIDARLSWKGKIYEDRPGPIRSFFALPLYASGALMGVMRGHRNVRTKNVPFTIVEADRLRLVQFLLEGALSRDAIPDVGAATT
jgi:hypothetical protein